MRQASTESGLGIAPVAKLEHSVATYQLKYFR
jgi:hypothetical protein